MLFISAEVKYEVKSVIISAGRNETTGLLMETCVNVAFIIIFHKKKHC